MKLQPFTSVGLSLIVSVMAVPACAVDQTVPGAGNSSAATLAGKITSRAIRLHFPDRPCAADAQ
jgi:hypothetical protein